MFSTKQTLRLKIYMYLLLLASIRVLYMIIPDIHSGSQGIFFLHKMGREESREELFSTTVLSEVVVSSDTSHESSSPS